MSDAILISPTETKPAMISSALATSIMISPALAQAQSVPTRSLGSPLWDLAGRVPSLDLNFAQNRSLVDATTGLNLVTFSRTSDATFVDSNGLIQTASAGTPRFDHNPITGESLGLLVEEQRTNLLLSSEEFDNNTTWGNQGTAPTVTANAVIAPNGTLTADRITFAAADSRRTQGGFPIVSGASFTISVYALAVGSANNKFRFNFFDQSAVFTTPDITVSSSNWQRYSFTFTSTQTNNLGYLTLRNASDNAANDIYFWGAQLEAGAFPTSYIPTTTAAATRSADVASISGSNFSSWYNEGQGTFFSTSSILGRNQTGGINYANGVFKVRDSTVNNAFSRTHHYHNDATQRLMAGSRDASGISFLADTGVATSAQTIYSMASAYTNATTDLALSLNGRTTIQSGSQSINLTGLTTMLVGAGYFGAIGGTGVPTGDNMTLNGHIRRLVYWKERLANNVLQSITQ